MLNHLLIVWLFLIFSINLMKTFSLCKYCGHNSLIEYRKTNFLKSNCNYCLTRNYSNEYIIFIFPPYSLEIGPFPSCKDGTIYKNTLLTTLNNIYYFENAAWEILLELNYIPENLTLYSAKSFVDRMVNLNLFY